VGEAAFWHGYDAKQLATWLHELWQDRDYDMAWKILRETAAWFDTNGHNAAQGSTKKEKD
jgi:hypothetical protein